MHKQPVDCPLCGSKYFKVIFEPWQNIEDPLKLYGAASSIRGTQRIVKCLACNMIFENPRFPDEVIFEGYRASSESEHDSQFMRRADTFHNALQTIASDLPPKGSKIIDFGCAGGAFLKAATDFGYDAHGIEISQNLVDQAAKRGLKVTQGSVTSVKFSENEFHMASLWDVLEHTPNPQETLKNAFKLLKKNGILLLTYPDIGTSQARLFGSNFWWLLSGHLHYFTGKTIRKLVEQCGFEILRYSRYRQTLQIGYLQDIAIRLQIPGSRLLKEITPRFIQNADLTYYASQTLVVARVKS